MFVSRKDFNAVKAQLASLVAELEVAQNFAYLVSIERVGQVNKFTFMRGEQTIEIETAGLISDDLPGWKEKLLR